MSEKVYTIEEAVEYTGIKRRTFENLRISYGEEYRTAKDGKERKVRVYNQSELDRAKDAKNKKHVPALDMQTSASDAAQVATVTDLQNLAAFLSNLITSENQKLLPPVETAAKKKQIEISSFKDKLILNFAQALAYSGLTKDDLKHALEGKQILGKKTSEKGTWKINRQSLDEFCKTYFE